MDGDLDSSPATVGGSDVMSELTPDCAVSSLPETLDLTQAKPLRDRLAAYLAHGSIMLDAATVSRMSTPCAQVLLAAGRAAVAAGAPFKILNASAVFRSALAELGLQLEFSKWMT